VSQSATTRPASSGPPPGTRRAGGVGRLTTRRPVTLDARSTLADVATMLQGTARHTAYPVLDGDAIRGLFPLHVLAETPPSEWARRTVGECLIPARLRPPLRGDHARARGCRGACARHIRPRADRGGWRTGRNPVLERHRARPRLRPAGMPARIAASTTVGRVNPQRAYVVARMTLLPRAAYAGRT
jgi:hypothetical protein